VDSYPDTPKWAGSAFAEVKFPLPETIGKVSLRGDYYGQTSFYFSNTNGTSTPGTKLDGYDTIGMRLNWREIMQSRVSAALYVRNLTKNTYYISGYALGASNGVNTAYPGEPRTFGAELKVEF
jgi:iron complex outermembrane receptor protein